MKFLLLTVLLPVLALSAVVPQQPAKTQGLEQALSETLVATIRKNVQTQLLKHRIQELTEKMTARQAQQAAVQKPGLNFLCKLFKCHY